MVYAVIIGNATVTSRYAVTVSSNFVGSILPQLAASLGGAGKSACIRSCVSYVNIIILSHFRYHKYFLYLWFRLH